MSPPSDAPRWRVPAGLTIDALYARLTAAAPRADDPPRVALYRRMVRENLRTVLDNAFPVTRGALGPEGWSALVEAALAGAGPRSPLYSAAPATLVAHAREAGHAYAELLDYEWLELVAARHPAELDAIPRDAPTQLNPTMQLGLYTHAVERVTDEAPALEPLAAPTAYLVWRRPRTDEVVFHRAGLVLARTLELWAERGAADAVATVAAESGLAPDVIQRALADGLEALRARDGVLGGSVRSEVAGPS
jgi:hypothetical protein